MYIKILIRNDFSDVTLAKIKMIIFSIGSDGGKCG